MKRILSFVLAFIATICLSLFVVSCSGGGNDTDSSSSKTQGGGSAQSGQTQTQTLSIGNRPTGDKLTITDELINYTLNVGDYNGEVSWISTVTAVATISNEGVITLVDSGVTEIIAEDKSSSARDSFILTVEEGRQVETIEINGIPQTVRIGDKPIELKAVSSSAGETQAEFTSSNESVATIDGKVMTIVGIGKTTITAVKVGDASVSTSIQLTVLGKVVESVEFTSIPEHGILVGSTYELKAKLLPENAEQKEIDFSLAEADGDYATIDSNNNLIAIKKGVVTLTAKVRDTEISLSREIEICELSNDKEDFRFAESGTGNITNVGPSIYFYNADCEIIEYGEDRALLLNTRGNGGYNYLAIDFGLLNEGYYQLTLKWLLYEGVHEGAIVNGDAKDNFTTIWWSNNVDDDIYSFTFQHSGGNAKISFVAPNFDLEGKVIIDDIVLKKVDEPVYAQAESSKSVNFDSLEKLTSPQSVGGDSGIYLRTPRKFNAKLVEDGKGGKALNIKLVQAGYASFVWNVGQIAAGQYKVKIDISGENYPAIIQLFNLDGAEGYIKCTNEINVNYRGNDRLYGLSKKSGNTYEMTLTVTKDMNDFAIAFASNIGAADFPANGFECTMDNLSFEKIDDSENERVVADFETASLVYTYNKISGINVNANVTGYMNTDFANNANIADPLIEEHTMLGKQASNALKVNMWGWNGNVMFNLGYLKAGEYTVSIDLDGEAFARGTFQKWSLTQTGNVDETTRITFAEKYTSAGTYTFTFTVSSDSVVLFNYKDGANGQTTAAVYFDNVTIKKIA